MKLSQIADFQPMIRKTHLQLGDQLGLAIMRGDFKEGELLPSEAKLCETLGVSRTSMREAMRGLVAKGILESQSKGGTRVRKAENWYHLDVDVLRWQVAVADSEIYLRKMFQLRYATEPAAASIAAQYATPEDHTAIGEAFDAMQTAGKDLEKWIEADLRFHKAIYLATHNEFFWSIGQLFNIVLKEMFKITASGAHRPRALAEHRALMEAIFAGTSEAARELSLKMVSNATDDVLSVRRSASPKLQREPT